MDDDLFVFYYLGAEFCFQLGFGSLAVASGSDQNGDVGIGIAFSYFSQHLRNDYLTGNGAGVVACNEHDLILSLGKLPQRGTADRIFNAFGYGIPFAQLRQIFIQTAFYNAGKTLFGDISFKYRFTVR